MGNDEQKVVVTIVSIIMSWILGKIQKKKVSLPNDSIPFVNSTLMGIGGAAVGFPVEALAGAIIANGAHLVAKLFVKKDSNPAV
jgi:hypothetical protein